MAGNIKRRKRKIDVEKLTIEQADRLMEQITKELAKILDTASAECNEILNIYGLEAVIGYQIQKKTEEKRKVKRTRKKASKS